MPGKVRVKIVAGRNLPVMDRGSDTTDAFVEIKLANITYKTDVYKKSLNPQWNSDFYRFELDDAELQDEILQIRLMDHDTYSANDAIGKVNISLNPLLLPSLDTTGQVIRSGKGAVMSGWMPVFDTMHGIRGEVNIIVKVDLFSDVNKFRQSSCGVQFFHSPNIPYGFHAQIIHGFVEELVVNDDPEYQWIDKIRTPRASNEARQTVFLKLSGQVQRKIGLKAIDLGANAVIGYTQCFDLEGDVGVVARGIGTAVTLVKIQETLSQPMLDNALLEEQLKYLEFLTRSDAAPRSESKFDSETFNTNPGDIVYKILGITPNDHSRIVINKKSKKYDSQDTIFEEEPTEDIENLKVLLEQEDNRGRKAKSMLKQKMKRIGNSSKNMLSKRMQGMRSRDDDDNSSLGGSLLSDSLSELSMRCSTSSLRSSVSDIRGILKKGIPVGQKQPPPKYHRSSSDGVGMAALLVRSMMAAPSLDCITETHDTPKSSPTTKVDHPKSESLCNLRAKPSKKDVTYFQKPQIHLTGTGSDLKISDSNLSSTMSLSSCTLSSTSDAEESESEEVTQNDIVLVDADTVSMVVKSVLAQEECQTDKNDWIDPSIMSSTSSSDSVASSDPDAEDKRIQEMIEDSCKTIRTGSSRVSRDSKGHYTSNVHIVETSNPNELEMFLRRPATDLDAENWIQPGSTTDEPECLDRARGSLFHDIKENLSEKIHHIQDHIHFPHHEHHEHNEITHHKHGGLLSHAMDNILIEQAKMLGVSPSNLPLDALKYEDLSRRGSIDSLRKRLTTFYKRGGHVEKSEVHHEGGMIDTAMKTMLMDTANINEEMVVHPMNNPPSLKVVDNVLPFLSMTNLNVDSSEPSDLAKNSYGSAVDISELREAAKPFISLTDLANLDKTIAETCPVVIASKPTNIFSFTNSPKIQFTDSTPTPPHGSGNSPQRDYLFTNTTTSTTTSSHQPPVVDGKHKINLNTSQPASCDSSNTTNKAFLLAPTPFPVNRSETVVTPNKAIGHIRAESASAKMSSHSPSKAAVAVTATPAAMAAAMSTSGGPPSSVVSTSSKDKDPICRRSSDSDLSVTPKVLGRKRNSLSTNISTEQRPAATGFNRPTTKVKAPLMQDNLDMLEYPFLTLSKYPVGFILHLGATVCARSVKLLERVPNPDEPETRDSWWTELRMEIRSHARALGCNVILGYSEVTSISDDVCVLSVTGTAAIINLLFTTGEIGLLNTTLVTSTKPLTTSTKDTMNVDVEKDQTKSSSKGAVPKETTAGSSSSSSTNGSNIATVPANATSKGEIVLDVTGSSVTNKENNQNAVNASLPPTTTSKTITSGSKQIQPDCAVCHIPYSRTSVPFNVHMKKCAICKHGIVPDVLLTTIEIPESLQITGRGCFLQAQVCRTKKDLKSELNAKEISDGLPFLEYDLHRLLINKLKTKGMNAIFGLKATVTVGEKMIALIATGTAVFLTALPAPTVPKIVAGNSWTNAEKLNELQKSLQDTIDRNREIYQLKSFTEFESNAKNPDPDTEEEEDDTVNEIDLTVGNKGTFVLEVDDIEDLEIISLLMEPCPPEGFHVVNTHSVPGLHDLEVIRNLQMFTQVWRAKLSLNQQGSNFPKHFQRLLQTIYFKLRTMIPCAICDLKFVLDLPDSDEIQLLVTGMALGLGEPSKLTKYKRKIAAPLQTKESRKLADDELIFSLEEEHVSDLSQTQSLTFPLPVRERYGVDITPLGYVPGGKIEKYLGNLNFFFIRECTSIRENGGVSGFVHSFITEMLAVVRAHVTALGGNALVSFYMTELILVDNPHKNQGQCLISVGGDVVFVSYFSDD